MKGPQEKSGYFQGQSPFFVQRLVGVSADQGDHVELKCEVNGRPLPKVKWWKGSTPINPKDAGMIISHQGNHHFLTLESVRVIKRYRFKDAFPDLILNLYFCTTGFYHNCRQY